MYALPARHPRLPLVTVKSGGNVDGNLASSRTGTAKTGIRHADTIRCFECKAQASAYKLADERGMYLLLRLPWIGGEPIAHIAAPGVLAVLRRIESRGVMPHDAGVSGLSGRAADGTAQGCTDPEAARIARML